MGSFIEINDTLQISKEQGFPSHLSLAKHLESPYSLHDLQSTVFSFSNKTGIRLYKMPPVRNFLVENLNGKWVYWGLVHILEVTHDCINKMTSGKYKIIYLYTPEEMKKAHELIDRNRDTSYFG